MALPLKNQGMLAWGFVYMYTSPLEKEKLEKWKRPNS